MALENPEELNRHFKVEGELALEQVRARLDMGVRFDEMSQSLLAKALREQVYRNRIMRVVAEELARLALEHHSTLEMVSIPEGARCVRKDCDTCVALGIWKGLPK